MSPGRRRRVRMAVALAAAVLLAGALAYTSFTASSQAVSPSGLLAGAVAGRTYQLTGKVVPGYRRAGDALDFRVRDRDGGRSVPVRYVGAVPDPFRGGREVIVTVRKEGSAYVGVRDSLLTKCPSKFATTAPGTGA
ncbi:MAG: cytochrome c-type biosis protein CcmE [Solirubrobacteraceae bacterium]|nr:cytochrome c-type biosis protein CcmE [Solirubrobacteraceae bacterium]